MIKTLQRGFTLIELLVVIAIIGILAAVVLSSLNDARNNGTDASIKQSMASFRSQAELVYNSANFSYATVCTASSTLALRTAIEASNGATTANVCNASATAWALSSPLVTNPAQYWCVDSTGAAGVETTALTSGTVCP